MKTGRLHFSTGIGRTLLGVMALTLLFAFGAPQAAQAAISGNATVHNKVTVEYDYGNTTATAYASVDVTVATVAAAPTITVPGDDTTTYGTALSYDIEIRSNANGLDTYALNQSTAENLVASATYTYSPEASIDLWGGITVAPTGSGTDNYLYFPGGALTGSGLVADATSGSIIYYNNAYYMVTTIDAGAKAETDASGNTTPEDQGFLVLAPQNIAADITSWNAGQPVGEVKTITYSFTAGAPGTAGVDGFYTYSISAETTATGLDGITKETAVAQTFDIVVQSPSLSITKQYRVVASGSAVPDPLDPTDYSTTGSVKPGQVIEYLITIENTNTNADSLASSVTITDPLPPYTNYVPGSTYVWNGTTVRESVTDGAGSTSPLAAGYPLADPVVGASTAYIVFQVKVQ